MPTTGDTLQTAESELVISDALAFALNAEYPDLRGPCLDWNQADVRGFLAVRADRCGLFAPFRLAVVYQVCAAVVLSAGKKLSSRISWSSARWGAPRVVTVEK